MSRKIFFAFLILAIFTLQSVFAQNSFSEPELTIPSFYHVSYFADVVIATDGEFHEIIHSIRDNEFFLESQRLAGLAHEAYEYGDYDSSASYAIQAIHYADLSDEFISFQLKIIEAGDSIEIAKQRLDWVESLGLYTEQYNVSYEYYEEGLEALAIEDWDEAIAAATRVIETLAFINGDDADADLPKYYVVRPWISTRDCLWNIAGYSWVYNDPYRWTVLYEANKANMPEPDNPDLIEVGMILEIPSIRGEVRQGTWQAK
jgi:hypothetical protein